MPEPPAATAPKLENKSEVTQDKNNQTRTRNGYVDLNEIGGEGLTVVSVFKPNTSVSPDGSFDTIVSAVGAQLVMVTDKNKELRATAISLPEDKLLVFDAKSTTKASMWIGGSATQEEGEWALALMETYKCYPNLYAYMKSNLKQKSLSKITNFSNTEYMNLQMQCANETLELIKTKMPN